MTLRDMILAALRETGLSINAIAKQARIPQSSLWRFAHQRKGLQFDALERLWAFVRQYNDRAHIDTER